LAHNSVKVSTLIEATETKPTAAEARPLPPVVAAPPNEPPTARTAA